MEYSKADQFSPKTELLCRICLKCNGLGVLSLFNDQTGNWCHKIMLCTSVKLYPIEGLPISICRMCCEALNAADNFRLKCLNSDLTLRKTYPELFTNENDTGYLDNWINTEVVSEENKNDGLGVVSSWKACEGTSEGENSKDVDCGVVIKEEEDNYSDSNFTFDANKIKKVRQKRNRTKKSIPSEDTSERPSEAGCSEPNTENKKTWTCEMCGKTLSKRCILARHMELMHSGGRKAAVTDSRKTGHGKEKRFHCQLCPFVTKFSQTLVYHERTHTGERPHVCPHCNRAFSHPGNLTTHLTTHSDKTHYKCDVCSREFKTKSIYVRHRGIHSENRKVYSCQLCDAKLKAKQAYDNHMKRHNNIKEFSCETCGYRFVTLEELINHSKKHTSEKNFKCDICDFRTALKRSLQTHIKRHLNPRSFKCQACDLACFTKYELANHQRTHTRECNYSCMLCDRKFIQSSSLNKHVQRTHGVKIKRDDNIDRRKVK